MNCVTGYSYWWVHIVSSCHQMKKERNELDGLDKVDFLGEMCYI